MHAEFSRGNFEGTLPKREVSREKLQDKREASTFYNAQWMSTMPRDDDVASEQARERDPPESRPSPKSRSFFSLPPSLKRVFDQFPLISYSENELPLRSPRLRDTHTLWVFATDDGAINGAPSFNPSCLKWQVRSNRIIGHPTLGCSQLTGLC